MPPKTTTVKKNAKNKKDDIMTDDKKGNEERTRLVTDITSAGDYTRTPRVRGGTQVPRHTQGTGAATHVPATQIFLSQLEGPARPARPARVSTICGGPHAWKEMIGLYLTLNRTMSMIHRCRTAIS